MERLTVLHEIRFGGGGRVAFRLVLCPVCDREYWARPNDYFCSEACRAPYIGPPR